MDKLNPRNLLTILFEKYQNLPQTQITNGEREFAQKLVSIIDSGQEVEVEVDYVLEIDEEGKQIVIF